MTEPKFKVNLTTHNYERKESEIMARKTSNPSLGIGNYLNQKRDNGRLNNVQRKSLARESEPMEKNNAKRQYTQ